MKIFLIFMAGGLGTLCRHGLGFLLPAKISKLPLPTLMANVLGCFAIGLIIALFQKQHISDNTKQILTVGFCGGFTTFSALSLEALSVFNTQSAVWSLAYIVVSIVAGVLATYFGMLMVK
jgi:fluoride exporter